MLCTLKVGTYKCHLGDFKVKKENILKKDEEKT